MVAMKYLATSVTVSAAAADGNLGFEDCGVWTPMATKAIGIWRNRPQEVVISDDRLLVMENIFNARYISRRQQQRLLLLC